jgi:small subunit ribosomal protein S20
MANTKTAKKQILISKRNHERNVAIKSRLKSTLKQARLAIAGGGDAAAATEALNKAVKTLYKSATKGIIKKQNASRRVSRLMLSFQRAFDPNKPAAEAAPAKPAVKAKAAPKPKATKATAAAPETPVAAEPEAVTTEAGPEWTPEAEAAEETEETTEA